MPAFPSREWMIELCEHVVAHPEAGALAHGLDGVYAFVVDPAGPLHTRQRYDLAIRPEPVDGARAELLDEPVPHPRLTFTARFDRWWQLINGDLDPRLAIMLRRLRVSGDVWRLGKQLSTVTPLLEALARVDTQWPA